LRLYPVTGRTHQLRVHLLAVGHPVAGDRLYQLTDEEYRRWREEPDRFAGRFPLRRQALHCAGLRFRHPWTGEILRLNAPLPEDLTGFLKSLRMGRCGRLRAKEAGASTLMSTQSRR
jgi:23S rRNA-/tRNA-specific pseudouridylate synthase